MPAADAHVHLFANSYAGSWGPLLRNELEVYEQLRVRFAIERALVVGYEAEPRYSGNNAYILELARTRPWIVPLPYLEEQPPGVDGLRQLREAGGFGYAIYVREQAAVQTICAWPTDVLAELNR